MRRYFFLAVIFLLVCTTGCETTSYSEKADNFVMPPLRLKKLVAVDVFENKAGFGSEMQLGTGMADMLTDSLMQSGFFRVMERQAVESVVKEQDFAAGGRTTKAGSVARIGKMPPVQILIRGAVTEFDVQSSDGGQGITYGGVTIKMHRTTAHIAIIIRLIDTTTGQVLDSQRIEGVAEAGGLGVDFVDSDFDLHQDASKKTPVGKACQIAIDRAVRYIIIRMSKQPWEGKVIAVRNGAIIINAGSESGIKVGDRFVVLEAGEEFIDPDTGMSLGSDSIEIGEIEIFSVSQKFSKAAVVSGGGFEAKNIVREKQIDKINQIDPTHLGAE